MKGTAFCLAAMVHLKFSRSSTNATEDVPTEQSPSRQDARIARTNAHTWGPTSAESQKGQRAQASFGQALLTPQTLMPAPGNSFPKHMRLRNSSEFQNVYENGRKKTARFVTLFVMPNGLHYCRLGITTPRKLGKA